MRLGVDLGGADSSSLELFSVLSRKCASLPLDLYVPRSQLPLTVVPSSCHRLVYAEQEISGEELPVQAVRLKKQSSLKLGLNDLKDGKLSAFLSLANTGALVLASSFVLGRIKGIHGPALVALFPSMGKEVAVLDVGAYPKDTPERYQELVSLGVSYYQARFSCDKPIVGLLNIGHEATKGTDTLRQADYLLKVSPNEGYSYFGFVEPIDIFQGSVDVAVTDGFTGNVLLKTAEGAQEFLHRFHKTPKVPRAALLLGVCGDVYKCHGRTSPDVLAQIVLSLVQQIESMSDSFSSSLTK